MKTALITGITGQDGSYLAEYLLHLGYEVHGIIRRSSTFGTERIDHIFSKLHLHYGDLSDGGHVSDLIFNLEPDEIYNLGAQSHVGASFNLPVYTSDIDALGVARILETVRKSRKEIKLYQASSSEMFGNSLPPQNEASLFQPRSPYSCSKLYSYWMVKNYREGYNMFASNGILFNHESPRRGRTFVTRKITQGIANILALKQDKISLGNLTAYRDWGFAPEYCMAMHEILQRDKPDDYVLGTGSSFRISALLSAAFSYVNLDWTKYVSIDQKYYRPTEVQTLISDPMKARLELAWRPKITFNDLVKIMIDADMRTVGLSVIGEGDAILDKKFPDKWWRAD